MNNLIAADWVELDGRPVAVCRGVQGLDPRTLGGEIVMIDSTLYRVRRVQTFAVMNPTGMDFGLQLEPIKVASAQGDGAGE